MINSHLQWGAKILSKITNRPRLEAEILLAHILQKDRIFLHTHSHIHLSPLQKRHYQELIKRRRACEPIEYILQKVSFYGKDFFIKQGALIPRPETEILVDHCLAIIQKHNICSISEIGIGSGAISIILAHLHPHLQIHASDILPEALFISFVNMQKFGIDNIKLHLSSYLDFSHNLSSYQCQLLIANPPYIALNTALAPSLSYEPKQALFAGQDGDEAIKHIIKLSYDYGIKILVCEIGWNQKQSIKEFLRAFSYKSLTFYQDLSSIDRGFILEH